MSFNIGNSFLFLQSQYIFIHDAVLEHLVCGETQIPVTNFRVAWNQLSRIHKDNGKTGLERQYQVKIHRKNEAFRFLDSVKLLQVLKKITPHSLEVERKSALKYPHLNRSMDYLPSTCKSIEGPVHIAFIIMSITQGYK